MAQTVFSAEARLASILEKRRHEGALRTLRTDNTGIDFCSNDYLGFASSECMKQLILQKQELLSSPGSTGSRLLRGNSSFAESLEQRIAAFHEAKAGLIFNSGYDANVGLFSSLISKTDTVVYDSLIHASVRDGIRLSGAKAFNFQHNDCLHLEERLKSETGNGNMYVAVESVYSMDGDEAPLMEIAALCRRYDACLIVDEAHATGVKGISGQGLVHQLGLGDLVFARVHTFGKALGCHGAIVLGSSLLREWLINYARAFIYTTALPPSALAAIASAYDLLEEKPDVQRALDQRIALFRALSRNNAVKGLMESSSPIQCILVPGNTNVRMAADKLQKEGFDVRPILSPTVPAGKERLRICIHAFNTEEEIGRLISFL
jgi:8-amino-7-oxononanoate synthase